MGILPYEEQSIKEAYYFIVHSSPYALPNLSDLYRIAARQITQNFALNVVAYDTLEDVGADSIEDLIFKIQEGEIPVVAVTEDAIREYLIRQNLVFYNDELIEKAVVSIW